MSMMQLRGNLIGLYVEDRKAPSNSSTSPNKGRKDRVNLMKAVLRGIHCGIT